ncbi:MAG: hypothetical protein M3P84_07915 [Chloroflexota bacterium]|nr:hypothetical protein [Chloroflexota bacterium]
MAHGLLTTAALDTLRAPRLWTIGLAGFLARGGIVPFALPVIVLPSVVGLTTFIGPNSVTAAGLAPRLVVLLALTAVTLAATLLLGTLVGVATERALIGAIVTGHVGEAGRGSLAAGSPALAALVAIRLVALVPVGVAVALGGAHLGQVAYQELILPSDSSAPFVVRVLLAAPEVVVALVAAWLVSELVGAVAVRLALLDRRSIAGALGGALVWIARRPVRSLAVLVATTLGSVVLIGPALVGCAVAWSVVRTVLLGGSDPTQALGLVGLFVSCWIGGLVLAGFAATWRSAAWSLAVVEDHRVGGPSSVVGGNL